MAVRTLFYRLLSDISPHNALDTRYFMIKSWNVENVEIAQRDVSRSAPIVTYPTLPNTHPSFPHNASISPNPPALLPHHTYPASHTLLYTHKLTPRPPPPSFPTRHIKSAHSPPTHPAKKTLTQTPRKAAATSPHPLLLLLLLLPQQQQVAPAWMASPPFPFLPALNHPIWASLFKNSSGVL